MTTATVKAPAVTTTSETGLMDRVRGQLTLLNLHLAGVAVLVVVVLYLLVRLGAAWTAAHEDDAAAMAQQTVAMKSAEAAAQPLKGVDTKLKAATTEADAFYGRRLPFAYSEVLGELGVLTKKTGVKLTRGQFAETPVLTGSKNELTEVEMDYGLTGDYRPLVLFINGLERDKMFFLIRGVALTGQQSGTVGLRLRLTTYLRAPVGTESSEKQVVAPSGDAVVDGGGAPR